MSSINIFRITLPEKYCDIFTFYSFEIYTVVAVQCHSHVAGIKGGLYLNYPRHNAALTSSDHTNKNIKYFAEYAACRAVPAQTCSALSGSFFVTLILNHKQRTTEAANVSLSCKTLIYNLWTNELLNLCPEKSN